jgi:signal transduction histidine kinase
MRHHLKSIPLLLLLFLGHWCMGQKVPYAISNIPQGAERNPIPAYFMESPRNPVRLQNEAAFLDEVMTRGEALVRDGKYEEAMLLYRNMLVYTLPVSVFRLNIYSQMANLLQNSGRYEEALRMHHLALGQTDNAQTQVKLYVNISGLYISLRDYDKALQSLDNGLRLLENNEGGYWTAIALINKGSIYNARNMYRSAILEFRKAYKVALSIPLSEHTKGNRVKEIIDVRSLVLNNMADTYMKLDMPDSALHYLQMVLPDFRGLSQFSKCFILVTLGEVYGQKKEDGAAVNYLKQGLAIGEQSGYQTLCREAYESLSLVYGRMGNYKEAWENQKKYTQLKDSLISIENIHKINTLERQYDISRRDKELVRKELLISQQAGRLTEQNWLAGILILAVVSLGSIFLVFRKSHRNKQKLLKEQLSSTIKDRKIMQIEAGMKGEEKERTRIARDLHDGVVSEMLAMKLNLQAMERSHLELKQSADFRNIIYQAEEVTDKLRMAAHNLMPANLQEHGLIQTISAFLNRINNHNVQFTFQHYGKIPELNEVAGKIILMMTMELIQNILKHAQATEAIIQFDFFDDSMSITVEDNGVGIPNSFTEKKGMGLTNIESNVSILNGTLDIKSSEYTGTTMLIEIPLNEQTLQNGTIRDDSIPED